MMAVLTQKKTFSIKTNVVKESENYKNKSKVVNQALHLYFSREKYLKKAEKEFLENFSFEWIENFQKDVETRIVSSTAYKNLDKTISTISF